MAPFCPAELGGRQVHSFLQRYRQKYPRPIELAAECALSWFFTSNLMFKFCVLSIVDMNSLQTKHLIKYCLRLGKKS